MIVAPGRMTLTDTAVRVSAEVLLAGGQRKDLWFSTERRFAEHLRPDNADPFLIALILVAMRSGESVTIEGKLSESLYYNAVHDIQGVLRSLRCRPSRVTVHPAGGFQVEERRATGVGTGFSGGVDSFCTLADHVGDACPPRYRLTHLFLHNVGALPSQHFDARLRQVEVVAEEFGLDVVRITSNMSEFFDVPFLQSHSLRNIACAALLPGLIGKYYYSSTHLHGGTHAPVVDDIADLDASLLHLLSTDATQFISAGGQYSRVEKTARIADMPAAGKSLHVCVSAHSLANCSRCWKCGRTQLTLSLLGKLHNFEDCFDLDVWERTRARFVGEFILNRRKAGDVFARELQELAGRVGYRFTARERALGRIAAVAPQRWYDLISGKERRRRSETS